MREDFLRNVIKIKSKLSVHTCNSSICKKCYFHQEVGEIQSTIFSK